MLNFSNFFNSLNIRKSIIRGRVKDTFSYLHVKIYTISIFILNILLWVLAKYIIVQLQTEQIALHYNVDFGVDYYGNAQKAYIIPLIGLIIFLINLSLVLFLGKQKGAKFFNHLLFNTSLSANLILLVGLISIYLINTR